MDAKRITLLLPSAIVEAAEQAAAAKNTTRHNYLCDLIISQIGGEVENKDEQEIRKIADLQRACISIMATWWGETNPDAPTKIRNIAGKIGVKI